MLRLFPPATLLLLIAPVAAGLACTALPAFGFLPAVGAAGMGFWPWRELLDAPGLGPAVALSLGTGLGTTFLSLALVTLFSAAWHGTRVFRLAQRLLSPLLAVPHVTVAFGLAFLLTPSGWILRLVSPWPSGLERPPDWLTVNDPLGLSLIAGLVLKEVPFLFLMLLAALGQSDAQRARTTARMLGYSPVFAWLKAVFPRVYPQIRLPIFAVLAYAMSVVDVSLVLGPSTPPPLAVLLLRWFNAPDLDLRLIGSAGALLQLALVLAALAFWLLLERLAVAIGRRWIAAGGRGGAGVLTGWASALLVGLCAGAVILSLAGMAVWSVARVWRYPAVLPQRWSLANWQGQLGELLQPGWNTLSIGLAAAVISLVLCVGCLENEAHYGRRPGNRALWLLYLPLLVPQIAFLFGLQVLLVIGGFDGDWLAVTWAHLVFVLPYVYLSLADPYRAWDERYARSARCLGGRPLRVLLTVKLPMLLRPLMVALAVGFAVSVGQYLPTLFAGAGRVATLTTEAVALSAGGDRRIIGIYAVLQMLLPFLGFALATGLPAWLFRNRRALQVAA